MKELYRAEVVKSMDILAHAINDESILDVWLSLGVADGDINRLTPPETIAETDYIDDVNFKELMSLFLKLMYRASNSGGLYCDGIVSRERTTIWQ